MHQTTVKNPITIKSGGIEIKSQKLMDKPMSGSIAEESPTRAR